MRFLLMLAVTAGIVYGIVKYKERLERTYGRYFDKEQMINQGAQGGDYTAGGSGSGGAAKLLRSARPEVVGEVMGSLAIDQACKPFVSDLQRLDLIALDKDHYKVSYQQIPDKSPDCAFNDPALAQVINEMRLRCKPVVNLSETINDKCAAALFMTRAAMTRQLYAAKPLSAITDLRVLTDLMFAEFSSVNNQTLPNLKRAKAVADRMLDLKPDMYVAAKVIAFAEVIEGLNTKASKTQMLPEEWTAAANAVAHAKQLNANDESLADAEMLIETRGFEPRRAVAYADRLIAAQPGNAKAHYIRAYALWQLGNRPGALASLKQAAALAPDNRQYAQTYVAASRPGAKSDAFKGSITFGVDSSDFER